VNVRIHREAGVRTALARLWQPVLVGHHRVVDRRGVARFAECGPGKVLSGLNRRIS
jgi:malonyl CoA-acyl carrier protein transacylase